MIDQICQRIPTIPMPIRVFCKGITEGLPQEKKIKIISYYVIENWLSQVAFKDMVVNGLIKTYYLKTNSHNNMKLMNLVLNRIFQMDEQIFTQDVLYPLKKLYQTKKEKIRMAYMELLDIPNLKEMTVEALFEDRAKSKYHHDSMCLTLNHIKVLYKFFKDNIDKFTSSKQSVTVLTGDIDYMNNEANIFSEAGSKQETLGFRKPGEQLDDLPKLKKYHIAYFPFYKLNDRSAKIDKKQKLEIFGEKIEEDVQDAILKKNLKIMLQEIDDLGAIGYLVLSKNNILDIRRCILQIIEKSRMNKNTS